MTSSTTTVLLLNSNQHLDKHSKLDTSKKAVQKRQVGMLIFIGFLGLILLPMFCRPLCLIPFLIVIGFAGEPVYWKITQNPWRVSTFF